MYIFVQMHHLVSFHHPFIYLRRFISNLRHALFWRAHDRQHAECFSVLLFHQFLGSLTPPCSCSYRFLPMITESNGFFYVLLSTPCLAWCIEQISNSKSSESGSPNSKPAWWNWFNYPGMQYALRCLNIKQLQQRIVTLLYWCTKSYKALFLRRKHDNVFFAMHLPNNDPHSGCTANAFMGAVGRPF